MMNFRFSKFSFAILAFVVAGVDGFSEEKAEKKEPVLTVKVRTTAYTHTESDHVKYGNKTALGTVLRYTPEYHSAAADWSFFSAGN